jgi:hypothetical protein
VLWTTRTSAIGFGRVGQLRQELVVGAIVFIVCGNNGHPCEVGQSFVRIGFTFDIGFDRPSEPLDCLIFTTRIKQEIGICVTQPSYPRALATRRKRSDLQRAQCFVEVPQVLIGACCHDEHLSLASAIQVRDVR